MLLFVALRLAFKNKHSNPGFIESFYNYDHLRLLIHVIKSEMLRKLRFARLGLPYRVLNGIITVLPIFTGKQSPHLLRTALRFASGCTSQIRAIFSRKDRQNSYYPVSTNVNDKI